MRETTAWRHIKIVIVWGQLNTWQCHWLTDSQFWFWNTQRHLWTLRHFIRVMEKTCPDQQKDNNMIFVKNFCLISQRLSMYLLDHSLRSGLGGACDQITASDRSFLHLPSNPLSSQLEQLRSRFNWRQCNLGEQIVNKNNLAISWSSNTLNNEHETSGNTSDHYDVSLSLLVLLLRIFSSWLVAAIFNL